MLYLERRRDQHLLLMEHRAAPASGPFPIELVTSPDDGPYLKLLQNTPSDGAPLERERDSLPLSILDLLSKSTQPVPTETIRSSLGVRKQRVLETLRTLSEDGKVVRLDQGYLLQSTRSH